MKHSDITNIEKGILAWDVLDHFPIFFLITYSSEKNSNQTTSYQKRIFNNNGYNAFNQDLEK